MTIIKSSITIKFHDQSSLPLTQKCLWLNVCAPSFRVQTSPAANSNAILMRPNQTIRVYDLDFIHKKNTVLCFTFLTIFVPSNRSFFSFGKNETKRKDVIWCDILWHGNLCLSDAMNIKVPNSERSTFQGKQQIVWGQQQEGEHDHSNNDVIDLNWIRKLLPLIS